MDPKIRALLTPGPAEIVRATQKDAEFINKLSQEGVELAQRLMGQRRGTTLERKLRTLSTLTYHSLTNLAGYQTLGEEYCGILQINEDGRTIPGKLSVATMILLTTFGQSMLEYITKLTEKYLSRLASNDYEKKGECGLGNRNRNWILDVGKDGVKIFKHYLPFLGQLHLALFFLQGTYYQMSKRLLGIQYLLVRRSFANEDVTSKRTLKYLMWISVINSCLTCINDSAAFVKNINLKQEENENSSKLEPSGNKELEINPANRCTLCLDQRRNPSLTPCGHIFCWDCIMDWLRSKQECPVCREQFFPSRVVPLQNYN